ncbi:hypothetical protein JMJ35_005525 [Cladonia borealis]|uniref:Nephrocystin 3-like N-terminal domain-containing protein n=1 Tax=Cladonia borealis TaxID=184061 RepID=A0AA39V1R2_9LECA|nr:hypothetical protein JMJ35_005525 [Cladonia borealis]
MGVPNEICVALDADHVHMTKFDDSANEVYQLIVRLIREVPDRKPKKLAEAGKTGSFHHYDDLMLKSLGVIKDDEQLAVNPTVDSANSEEPTALVELERRFLADLKSDWLDDVLIEDNSEGTCEWILHSREFDQWMTNSEPILWVRGPPGVGKTVLAKFVYRQLSEIMLGDASPPITKKLQWASAIRKRHPVSFQVLAYFLDSGCSVRNSGLSVLQSLLYQVLNTDQKFFRYIHGKHLFRRPQRGDSGQYMELLSAVLQDASLSGTVIVLDALDECEEASRSLLIKHLKAIVSQSKIKVLVTSRSIPAKEIEPSIRIDLDYPNEHVDHDINRYVTTAVKDLARERKLPVELESKITSKLLTFPSKSFLWVQLAIQSIAKALTLRDLRNKLERLTPSLYDLYSEILDPSQGLAAITLRRALYFVMIAEEPLQIQELSGLLAISQTWDSRNRSWQGSDLNHLRMEIAKNLRVEDVLENKPMNFEEDFMPYFRPLLNKNERSISLVHFTVQEFLQHPRPIADFQATFDLLWLDNSARSDTMPEVHSIMAILCLQYMFAVFRDQSDPLGFRVFAARHWTEHARKARGCQNEVLKALIMAFFETAEFVSAWLHVLRYARDMVLPSTSDIALILAAFDLGSLYGDLLGVSMESLATKDINQRNPLHFAAANNAISSVYWIKALCTDEEMWFDDMSTQTDTNLQTPLHLAAQRGHKRIVELLLNGTNSNFQFDGKVFEILASNGYKELFFVLYDKTKIREPNHLIHILNQAAKLDSVDLIEKITSDFHSRIGRGLASLADLTDNRISLLHAALETQSTTVLEFLLNKEDFREAVDQNLCTALHVAADEGNVPIASQLIEKGIYINARDLQGDGALHIASRNGFPELVRLLCEKGAIVDLRNNSGQLPAHLAAQTGDKDILQMLCDYGTNVLAMDREGRTTLHTASKAGQEATVHILVDAGADVDAQDFRGRTPTHYATESGDLRIFYNLLNAGADPMASDLDHIRPIHIAAEQGSELLTRALLDAGADPDCRDSEGRTPLHHSCSSKGSTITAANILLEFGADISAADSKGVHPIHLAAEQGSESLVRLLISRGADVNCSDTEGMRPLHYGCSSKRSTTAVVNLLIRSGTEIDQEDSGKNTPFHYAKQNKKKSVIKLLMDAGACYS